MNSKVLLTKDYPEILSTSVNYIAENDSVTEAERLWRLLEEALKETAEKLKQQPRLLKFYKKEIKKLKYIAFSKLDDRDALLLLRKNFLLQFVLPGYNIIDKLKQKLIFILLVEDRNKFKSRVKKALLENTERITPNHERKTIQDWLKKYISLTDNDDSKLKEAQFFTELRSDKNINPKELHRLMVLFDVYNLIKYPSDTPQGFEEEVPVVMNGKLYIFKKGVLEETVSLSREYEEAKKLLAISENNQSDDINKNNEINELEDALQKYPPGSLEYRAIEQELKRVKNK